MLHLTFAVPCLVLPVQRHAPPEIIHDGVFSASACSALHVAAVPRELGHALYRRRSPSSPLELAIDSYLEEMGDSEPLVEYWSRQEWMHLEAHADVDEALAAATGCEDLRYPEHGHVLYLSVGPKVRGPTCVWRDGTGKGPGGDRFGAMSVVPAVAGRVLRFDGHLQHAVPRPHNVWLLRDQRQGSAPGGATGDYERSVVLFNT